MQKKLIFKDYEELKKAQQLLAASVDKYIPFEATRAYSAEELESYDALAFRFEKMMELLLHFFKGLELFELAKNHDTLRDRLLYMVKIGLIDDVESWMQARILRNKIAHDYLPQQLEQIYAQLVGTARAIFVVVDRIDQYLQHSD